jgi:hypothetical protein
LSRDAPGAGIGFGVRGEGREHMRQPVTQVLSQVHPHQRQIELLAVLESAVLNQKVLIERFALWLLLCTFWAVIIYTAIVSTF